MAMVNARIDDDLKARVDAVLQRRNITVTQNMTDLYRYIDQHEQSPFCLLPGRTLPTRLWQSAVLI
jgi:antitoxin component of RelBE/YafQ-DinJ toxin-antitoxin module